MKTTRLCPEPLPVPHPLRALAPGARSLTLACLFLGAANMHGAGDTPTPPPAELVLISQTWQTPAPGAIGLPCIVGGMIRFATEDVILEGPALNLRPALWSTAWVPGTGESFSFFQRDADRLNYDLAADAKGFTFVGRSRRGDTGIYSIGLNRVETTWLKGDAEVPHVGGIFERVQYPFTLGDQTVFVASGSSGTKGVYRATRTAVERIADTTQNAPETGDAFHDFSYARIAPDGSILFTGYSQGGSGIYIHQKGETRRLIDRHVVQPRTDRPYSGALLVGVEDSWAYFTSFGGTLSLARVKLDGGTIETLVDDETSLPGENAKVGALNYASVNGGRVLFEATGEGSLFNLFLWDQGVVRPLVRRGDVLPEGRILNVRSGLQALSGSRFVCLVDVYKESRESFARGVYYGELAPNGAIASVARTSQTDNRGWFRLGGGPVPVMAREPARAETTNGSPVRLTDSRP